MKEFRIALAAAAALAGLLAVCRAADAPPSGVVAEQEAAFKAAAAAAIKGPTEISIADEAKLKLPEGFVYIPTAQASRLMRSMGNFPGDRFQGLIVPRHEDDSFDFVTVSWQPEGYIKDDDARDWKAEKLLDDLKEGTEEANQQRRQMGIGEIEITGWIEAPRYDAASHQLVWSVSHRAKGGAANPAADDGINYRTLVLGREGYVDLTLVTDRAHFPALQPSALSLLGALAFNDGKRYADYQSGTDRVAEYGLAALVAGVAANKLGLIAVALAFFAKFAKLILVAVAGGFYAVRKWLGIRRKDDPASSGTPPATPGDPLRFPPETTR